MTYEEGCNAVEEIKYNYLHHTIVDVYFDLFTEMMVLVFSNGERLFIEVPRKDIL